ncbi:hypothetical protein ZIOFF_045969 [Zingiber officinale]|uniref:BTB domain-containing protein n=1 Tax=Zingiber officinale TaxID=94328 RepID=A0A8J5G1X9_ZINOF|nr:hypothetical protein ZIOFF_045969 [Zingiber officinale]
MEETLKCLSLDYLNLLINGQAFSDVTFSVEGRLVHAHRCILAARSLFFRRFFCGTDPPSPGLLSSPRRSGAVPTAVIPVNSVSYEVFLLVLQFLYSGQASVVPQKHETRASCGERGCWHAHCTAAVDLALDTLAAARSFGVKQLEQITEVATLSLSQTPRFGDDDYTHLPIYKSIHLRPLVPIQTVVLSRLQFICPSQ